MILIKYIFKALSVNINTTIMKCFVKGCNCNSWTKKDGDGNIKMFSFPKDKITRKKWYKACGVPHNYKNISSRKKITIYINVNLI
jgi:hypothetical protein